MYTKRKAFLGKNGDEWWGHELKGHTPGAASICNLLNMKKSPYPFSLFKVFWFFVKRRMHVTLTLALPFYLFFLLYVCVHYTQKNVNINKQKKITALRVPRLSPTLVLTEPEEA